MSEGAASVGDHHHRGGRDDHEQAAERPPTGAGLPGPLAWDDLAPDERTGPVRVAASVRARIDVEQARTSFRARLQVRHTLIVATVGMCAGLAATGTTGRTGGWIAGAVAGLVLGTAVAGVWSGLTGGPVIRQLRRQVRWETQVAHSLTPLESAGWTILHDRLVAAHRVPHILIGPPGVVLVYDYPAGSRWLYQGRRAAALMHSALALVLTVQLMMVHRRGLPPLSATTPTTLISPGDVALRTTVWARSELATRLAQRPELHGWTVAVTSFYVLLNRPPDRAPTTGAGVGVADLGQPMRNHMETALPAGLTHDAAALLAVIVDDTCVAA